MDSKWMELSIHISPLNFHRLGIKRGVFTSSNTRNLWEWGKQLHDSLLLSLVGIEQNTYLGILIVEMEDCWLWQNTIVHVRKQIIYSIRKSKSCVMKIINTFDYTRRICIQIRKLWYNHITTGSLVAHAHYEMWGGLFRF